MFPMYPLQVFISSSKELEHERDVIEKTIIKLECFPIRYEYWGSGPESMESKMLRKVRESDIYIGIFSKKFSEPTKKEYLEARNNSKYILLYIKDIGNEKSREKELNEFLEEITDPKWGGIYYKFKNDHDLSEVVTKDISEYKIKFERKIRENIITEKIKKSFKEIKLLFHKYKYKKDIPELLKSCYLAIRELSFDELVNNKSFMIDCAFAVREEDRYDLELDFISYAIFIDPNDPENYYIEGLICKEDHNNHKKAIDCFEKALEIEPKKEKYLEAIVESCLKLRHFEDGLVYLETLCNINPGNFYAWANKASCYYNLGRIDEALRCCNKALEINYELVEIYDMVAAILMDKKRYEEAMKYLDEFLKTYYEKWNAWIQKIELLRRMRKYRAALKCIDKALEINPTNTSLLLEKARLIRDVDTPEESMKFIDKKIIEMENNIDIWEAKIKLLLDVEDYDSALSCCDKALETSPGSKEILYLKSCILGELDKYEEAIEYADYLSEFYDEVDIWKLRGDLSFNIATTRDDLLINKMYLYEEVIEYYNRALELDPHNIGLIYNLLSCMKMINDEELEELLDFYLETYPNNEQLWTMKGDEFYESAETWKNVYKGDRESGGLKLYNKSLIPRRYDDMEICEDDIEWMTEDYEDALNCFDRLMKLNPDNPKYYLRKGCAQFQLGNFRDAIENYNKGLEKDPNNTMLLFSKGSYLMYLKKYKDALRYFQLGLSENKDHEYEVIILNRIIYCLDQMGETKRLQEYKRLLSESDEDVEFIESEDNTHYTYGNYIDSKYLL